MWRLPLQADLSGCMYEMMLSDDGNGIEPMQLTRVDTTGMHMAIVRTSRVITGIPFAVPGHCRPKLEYHDPPAQCYRQPAFPACEPTYTLPELELRNLLPQRIVP